MIGRRQHQRRLLGSQLGHIRIPMKLHQRLGYCIWLVHRSHLGMRLYRHHGHQHRTYPSRLHHCMKYESYSLCWRQCWHWHSGVCLGMMILGTKVCVTRGPIQTNKWPIFEFGHSLIRILQVIKLTFVLPHPQTLTLAPCGIHSPLWFLGIAIDAIRLALKLNDELSLRTQISLAWVLLL